MQFIFKSLESDINLDVNMSELKDFLYLLLDQLNQVQGALLTSGATKERVGATAPPTF